VNTGGRSDRKNEVGDIGAENPDQGAYRRRLLAVALVLSAGALPPSAPAEPGVAISGDGARLSVSVRSVPLQEVLGEISHLTGIEFAMEVAPSVHHAGDPFTVSFEALAIEDGLRRLLRHWNFVLVYSPTRLTEVRIYGDRTGGATNRSPAAVEAAPDADALVTADETGVARLRREALNNPDSAERAAALDGLLGSGQALDTALDVLEREYEGEAVTSALELLAGYESIPLEPIFSLATSKEPRIRIQALELLHQQRLRDVRVADALTAAATADWDDDVRESARALLAATNPE